MSLSNEYRRQARWRDWTKAFAALGSVKEQTIFDLGCGVGDQAAELVSRGARVVGFDRNEDLLNDARSRQLANADFRHADIRVPPDPDLRSDGIWCSFATAYIQDPVAMLSAWKKLLRPGGWIAITEIDDLFGHEPLSVRAKSLFDGYAREALATGRYDFHAGRKLPRYLARSGFIVSKELLLQDQELSFDGAAPPEIIEAWRNRFNRMAPLRDFCGAHYDQTKDEFLNCLSRKDHISKARVHCCIATMKP
jgi:ubiquinone/menaquinone biosynthesis C-methylase UbiE